MYNTYCEFYFIGIINRSVFDYSGWRGFLKEKENHIFEGNGESERGEGERERERERGE